MSPDDLIVPAGDVHAGDRLPGARYPTVVVAVTSRQAVTGRRLAVLTMRSVLGRADDTSLVTYAYDAADPFRIDCPDPAEHQHQEA